MTNVTMSNVIYCIKFQDKYVKTHFGWQCCQILWIFSRPEGNTFFFFFTIFITKTWFVDVLYVRTAIRSQSGMRQWSYLFRGDGLRPAASSHSTLILFSVLKVFFCQITVVLKPCLSSSYQSKYWALKCICSVGNLAHSSSEKLWRSLTFLSGTWMSTVNDSILKKKNNNKK